MNPERTTAFKGGIGLPINDADYLIINEAGVPLGSLRRVETGDRDYITQNGNDITGLWALRDADGTFVDYDRYRFDIAGRFGFELDLTGKLIKRLNSGGMK